VGRKFDSRSAYLYENSRRDAEKRAESFGLILRNRAFAIDDLQRDSARSKDWLQVYFPETTNLHVMHQDAISRRFQGRMMNVLPIFGQRRKQVEKTVLFGREFCFALRRRRLISAIARSYSALVATSFFEIIRIT
jgi:hypothetical protein